MAITRVTQRMMSQRSQNAVQGGLTRLAKVQEQMETGRKLNRPSDSPADTATALRVRSSLADQTQFLRNADDGKAWLSTVDTALSGITSQVQRAQVLAQQGANTASMSQTALDALATEVDQIRASVLQQANTQYLGRPVFGGTTDKATAFGTDGTYQGDAGQVQRRVGTDTTVQVNADGVATFGPDADNLFSHLAALSTALRDPNGAAGVQSAIATLGADLTNLSAAQATAGARFNRIDKASDLASQSQLQLKSSLSDVEDVDLAEVAIDLKTQEVAYQAALAATGKTIQPSLLDFLR
ncbi:flagellar hook-associated protein FlgL [Nocardioides sp. CER19]|uniref:flagellar hook-associated protein FlgL n=1 Tax=Nocardioides sp. CER19 TaxID=3038538 RepID=UPI00244ABBAB|nr:flagellar hook-associated protein FlgL [Nocardioides sp. CER19]MDH2414651.1 flagellar hook-associated protein FlgL [Nocardioides sp. CER19]